MDTPDVLTWRDGHIEALDQTVLPHEVRVLRITTVDELVGAIGSLAISPQIQTSFPAPRATVTTSAIALSTAGCSGS